jgi:hypothetical protein
MPIMRALYSLVSRARTVCALGQALATFARAGPAALVPMQLLVLGCGLCLLVTMLVPSPPPSGSGRVIFTDRLCSVMAAAAVMGLALADAVGPCAWLVRLALGV